MYHTYVIFSSTCNCYYCGHSDDVSRRIKQHNYPKYVFTKTTRRWPGPWSLIWQSAAFAERSGAMTLERKIKKRGIKRYLEGQDFSW